MMHSLNPDDSLRLSIATMGRQYKLSRNFTLGEFACKDGSDPVLIHPALIIGLQAIRDRVGRGVVINSGFRSVEYNKSIGGAQNSLHTLGMAADIVVAGMTPAQVAVIARELGFGGIKAYPTFTHIDVGKPRTW